jgi:myo-inositol-1(or 4)-monophosphatase
MVEHSRTRDLERIESALTLALDVARRYTPGAVEWEEKSAGGRWDPVTEADQAIDELLREHLPLPDEGWLSEETGDEPSRLAKRRVWVVDPLDGTREFVQGIPEWCVSVGLVEEGRAVAGGIVNPATGELVLGAEGEGVTLNGAPAGSGRRSELEGAVVLASRSEMKRGEWERFGDAPFEVKACGSVAYKLALVAAGLADATWTLVPKNEWDVAAGAALVLASGASVIHADGFRPSFNRADPLLPNFLAGEPGLLEGFRSRWL